MSSVGEEQRCCLRERPPPLLPPSPQPQTPPPPPSRTMVVVVTHVIYLGCNPLGPGATNAPHISIKRCGRHQPTNNLLLIGWEIYPVAYTAEDILVKRGGGGGRQCVLYHRGLILFFLFYFTHYTSVSGKFGALKLTFWLFLL